MQLGPAVSRLSPSIPTMPYPELTQCSGNVNEAAGREGESWLEDSSRILEETRLLMGSMEERQGRKAAMKSLFSRALTSLMDLVEHTIPATKSPELTQRVTPSGFLGEISQLELPAAQEHTARPPSAHGKPAWKEGNSARRNGSGGQYRAAGEPLSQTASASARAVPMRGADATRVGADVGGH
eukprot:786797-Rhodomonas_salina.2